MQRFDSLSKKQVRQWVGRHLLFWLVAMGGLLCESYAINTLNGNDNWLEILRVTVIMLPYNMLLTYPALYWVLTPALIGQYNRLVRRSMIYLPASWVLIVLYRGYVLIPLLSGRLVLFPNYQENIALTEWYIALVIVGLAVGIRLYRFWYERQQANQLLIHETLTIELQVLKAHIHPHFLFNTLNNLYSMTLKESPHASDMVMKLSGLLYYMIHECNKPFVPLAKEMLFLKNYVELEKLRYGNRLMVSMKIPDEIGTTGIAPLLFIPFVENAFKHGSAQQTGQASIGLSLVMIGNEMVFRISNSKDEIPASNTQQNTTGMGLTNVKKRLELLYPNAHELIISPEADRFSVELTIQLDHNPVLIEQYQSATNSPY